MPMSSLTLLVSVSIQPLDYYAYTAENSLSRVVPCVVLVPSDLKAYTLILSLSLSLFRSLTLQITALLPSLDDDVDVASSQDRISRYKTKASGSLGEKPSLGLGSLESGKEKRVCVSV